MSDDDSVLLGRLRRLWQDVDPPPGELADAMVAAVAAADLEDEHALLLLVHDSATGPAVAVRGAATARVLSFRLDVGGPTLEVEIDGRAVTGQVLDLAGAAEVVVEARDGATWSAAADEVGFFALEVGPTAQVRFVVRGGDRTLTTDWVAW